MRIGPPPPGQAELQRGQSPGLGDLPEAGDGALPTGPLGREERRREGRPVLVLVLG